MTRAKIFRSGNSQAVRLPKELRLDAAEVEITRHGDVLVIRPVRTERGLASAFDALASIEGAFLPRGREQGEEQERESF